jgi:hypothetical protein
VSHGLGLSAVQNCEKEVLGELSIHADGVHYLENGGNKGQSRTHELETLQTMCARTPSPWLHACRMLSHIRGYRAECYLSSTVLRLGLGGSRGTANAVSARPLPRSLCLCAHRYRVNGFPINGTVGNISAKGEVWPRVKRSRTAVDEQRVHGWSE